MCCLALNWSFYFVSVAVLATLVELLTGMLFRELLGVTLWSYAQQPWNLLGLICLPYSLLWGGMICLFMGVAWNGLERMVFKIPYRTAKVYATVLWIGVALDFVFNLLYLAVFGHHFVFW